MPADSEDLDPFQLSYVEESGQAASVARHGPVASRSRSPSPTPSLQLELQPKSQQLCTVPYQQQEVQPQLRKKTSAELNMKSNIWDHNDRSSDEEEVGLYKKYMADSFTKQAKYKRGEVVTELHEESHRGSDSLRREKLGFGVASGSKSGSEREQESSQYFPGSGFF